MFERWMGKALDRFLSQYFELNGDDESKADKRKKSSPKGRTKANTTSIYSAVWSGYISLHDLNVRVPLLNAYLQSIQVPISIVTFHIRTIEVTLPKYNPLSSPSRDQRDTAIFVMDGVHVLIRIHSNHSSDTPEERHSVRGRAIRQRRSELKRIIDPSASKWNKGGWKEWVKQQFLQPQYFQSLWSHLCDILQIHIRDVHVRLEHDQSTAAASDAYALGILLESLHIQHDMEAADAAISQDNSKIFKVAELNRFGIYWNALYTVESRPVNDRIEQKLMSSSRMTASEIVRVLDQMICRRSATLLSSAAFHIPQHTYILQPVDGQWHATIQTGLAYKSPSETTLAPKITIVCTIDDVSVQLRDFQLVQCLQLVHTIKEHKYNQRHWRYRPSNSITNDPKAWWFYAVAAIRRELSERPQNQASMRWSWKRWAIRQRYCFLYEKFLQSTTNQDDPVESISNFERNELADMEDGVVGDLTVQDIFLYRLLVRKRVGVKPSGDEANAAKTSWLRRKLQSWVGEDVDDDEYDRFLFYWQAWTSNDDTEMIAETISGSTALSSAIALEWCILQCQLTLFVPIGSTMDQLPVRRIQEKFMDFIFHGLSAKFSLLNDYESMILESSLHDVEVMEVRTNQQQCTIVSYESKEDPLWIIRFTKNTPSHDKCKYGIQGHLRSVAVDLIPECEWMRKMKLLLQPIPSLRKAAKFWTELNLAMINRWASRRLGLMAKAETVLSDHSAMDLDVVFDCPVLRITMDSDHIMVVNLGRASIQTEELSGFTKNGIHSNVEAVSYLKSSASHENCQENDRLESALLKTPTRHGIGVDSRENGNGLKSEMSVQLNSVNSAALGHKSRGGSDSVLESGPLGDNILIKSSSVGESLIRKTDSLFYDIYKVRFHIHGIWIQGPTGNQTYLLHETTVQCDLHRSVIPADHTLCQYKVAMVIENLSLSLSRTNVVLIGNAWSRWMLAASFLDIGSVFDDGIENESRHRGLLEVVPNVATTLEFSDFDEAEFFDAAEQSSLLGDDDIFIDDDARTVSEIGSVTASKNPSRRHRRRSSSLSEVSSISEGSRVKRKLLFPDGEHLTAENLARLEEEDDNDDTAVSEADSFRSAISLDYLVQLAIDLEREIVAVKSRLASIKSQLVNFRLLKSGGEVHDDIMNSEYYKTRDSLLLESKKAVIELGALEASRSEILAQLNEIESGQTPGIGVVINQEHVLFSAQKGTLLLKDVKRRSMKDAVTEHNLTENLSRELFHVSVSFQNIVLCVLGFDSVKEEGCAVPLNIDPSFTFCVSQASMIVHHRVDRTIFDAGIDSVTLFLQEHFESGVCVDHLMIGGIHNTPPEEMFATQRNLSEFDFASSDEKFLVFTCALHKGIARTTQKVFNVLTLRLNVGEIMFTLKGRLISTFLGAVTTFREELPTFIFSDRRDESKLKSNQPGFVSKTFDVAVVIYSVRCFFHDTQEIAAVLLVNDFRFRFMGSLGGQLWKDRIRVDCGCSNVRVVSFSESGRTEEVFGKSDAYRPRLIRARMKLQRVPIDFLGGWVLDSKLTESGSCIANSEPLSISSVEAVWNCHIGVKIDKIHAIAQPNVTRRLIECIGNLRRQVPRKTKAERTSNSPAVGLADPSIRWRIDFALKGISVGFRNWSVDIGDCIPESFDLSLSLFSSAQLSSSLQEGILLNCTIKQFCVVHSVDQWTVLKPSSLNAEVEFAVRNWCSTALKIKQLKLPDGFPWIEDQPINYFRSSGTPSSNVGQLDISALELCLPASLCVSMMATITALRASISSRANVKVVEKHTISSFERISQGISLTVCVASVLVSLYRPIATESSVKILKRLAALSIGQIEIACLRSDEMRELELKVDNISVIDFTCKSGVQCLSIARGNSDNKEVSSLNLSLILTSYVDRHHAAIDVLIGETQCLVLPTLVKSVLLFRKEMKMSMGRTEGTLETSMEVNAGAKILFITSKVVKLRVGLRVEAFELILSSKDIPQHVENSRKDAIGVVAIRLKIDAYSSYRVLLGNGDTFDSTASMLSSHFLDESVEQAVLDLQAHQESRTIVLSEFDLSVDDLQVLRTGIVRLEGSLGKFAVSQPIAGEQRITNAFCFKVQQQAVFLITSPDNMSVMLGSGTCVAHSIKIIADFVDVLVYISSSSGGMSDAIRVSVRPIMDLFKKEPSEVDYPDTVTRKKNLMHCMLDAALTLSICIDGLMFTFVPGGATQLTESPIVKFELSRFALGGALVPVKIDTLSLPDNPAKSLTSAPAISLHNLTLGCWVLCEVCASYHNRRLVAWEPFVEPWELEVRLGIDFVQANLLGPTFGYEALRESPNFEATSPFFPYDTGGRSRLENIGRFLRLPFSNERIEQKVGMESHPSFLETEIDLSFFILRNIARIMIISAMLPSFRPTKEESDESALCSLPGSMPVTWLHQFGFPVLKNFDSYDSSHPSALLCWISDCTPLNVNLTGAFIETLSEFAGVKARSLAPHWIRNDSGLDIRFHEVLDTERVASNEEDHLVIVRNGSQVPLSLRRSMSQSCDPHRAFISLELGNFEETVGRVELPGLPQSGRSKSLLFSYRVTTKISVDTVGSHRYPIDWNIDRRSYIQETCILSKNHSLGWIIVRVALNGGVKMVTIESPLMLKSDIENDLLCEVRDHGGLSLLWRCLLRKCDDHGPAAYYPVPPDIVPSLHLPSNFFGIAALPKNISFEHETDVPQINVNSLTRISPPAPYSSSSFGKGLIDESQVCVRILKPHFGKAAILTDMGMLHIDACSLRIGSFTLDHNIRDSHSKENSFIPEQRLLVFRPCIAIRNYLAFPIQIQVKPSDNTRLSTESEHRIEPDDDGNWTNLGVLDCSLDRRWSEAKPFAAIDMRIRIVANEIGNSYQFPHWSLPLTITSANLDGGDFDDRPLHIKLHDSSGVPLLLCVVLNSEILHQDLASSFECVKDASSKLSIALRVLNIYAPFWIVNGTGLDLQFKSKDFIAGQFDVGFLTGKLDGTSDVGRLDTHGLGELLDDIGLSHLISHESFDVLMLGNEASTMLQIRRRSSRLLTSDGRVSSWSDPIVISDDKRPYQDFIVYPPPNHPNLSRNQTIDANGCVPFLLRSRIIRAPSQFGGQHGTKLVYIACRYLVVNELGSEIEILSGDAQCTNLSIAADGYPHSFHFDDSLPIRVRPKEFGWLWSGKFNLRHMHREVTFSVKHSIKKRIILVTVECHPKHPAGTIIVVFRRERQAPYRIENHSMYPIKFCQVQKFAESLFSRQVDSQATHNIILPFHNAEFAWEEPEYGRRLIRLELAEFGDLLHNLSRCPLGTFSIDGIVPGTEIELPVPNLMGKVMADGPCRVLRISQRSISGTTQNSESLRFPSLESSFVALSATISARFAHGFGLSVVDWQPQELVYIRFHDIQFEANAHREKETLKLSVESVVVDNQLWVTPYPVLLRVGTTSRKRKNSRQPALSLYLNRVLTKQSIAGNFTQLENWTLSSLPTVLCIDGNLAAFAIQMVSQAKQIVSKNSFDSLTTNQRLCKALDIGSMDDKGDTEAQQVGALSNVIAAQNLYHALDSGMATAAIASKLHFLYRPPDLVAASKKALASIDSSAFGLPLTQRHKIYVERLRVSTTAVEISWSGVLPIGSSMPRLLRPTLTFEGLPLMLRAYSSSYAFGSLEEHLLSIKSHYLSIWRFVDLLVGVGMKPSFLVRAWMFTSRESCSLFLSTMANGLRSAEKYWRALVPKSWDEDPSSRLSLSWLRRMIRWSLLGTSSVLGGFSKLSASTAMLLQYNASRHRAIGGLVRGRNPRLFAHLDGNKLLVPYVEGENAGKAILSRVGSGELLGEGYVYHVEGVHLPKNIIKWESGLDSTPLILMLTLDRMLLLHGKLDNEFCCVIWEATYADVVFVEYFPKQRHSELSSVRVWYLKIRSVAASPEERLAKSLSTDAGGLDSLQCKQLFFPLIFMNTLRSKLLSVAPLL